MENEKEGGVIFTRKTNIFVVNLFNFSGSRIDYPNSFIFASRNQFRAFPVPASAVDDIRMAIDLNKYLAGAHIPQYYLIVGACKQTNIILQIFLYFLREEIIISFFKNPTSCKEYVLSWRMPQHKAHSSLVK